jgi:hypothetical protein
MNKKEQEQSEVVKIRIGPMAKKALTEEANTNYRSFQDQVRLVLDQWMANYINKKEGRVTVVLGKDMPSK